MLKPLTPRVTVFGHSADERAYKDQAGLRGWGLNSIGLDTLLSCLVRSWGEGGCLQEGNLSRNNHLDLGLAFPQNHEKSMSVQC